MPTANTRIRTIHTVITTVKAVTGTGEDWWVHFEGSRESLAFHGEKPFEPGEKVKITFERVTDGKFS